MFFQFNVFLDNITSWTNITPTIYLSDAVVQWLSLLSTKSELRFCVRSNPINTLISFKITARHSFNFFKIPLVAYYINYLYFYINFTYKYKKDYKIYLSCWPVSTSSKPCLCHLWHTHHIDVLLSWCFLNCKTSGPLNSPSSGLYTPFGLPPPPLQLNS